MSDGGWAPADTAAWRRARLVGWFALVVVGSLGIGGLVGALDHPAGDLTRPELTARRDRAAAPVIATLGDLVEQLGAEVEALRPIGRDALLHATGSDAEGLTADIALGTRAIDGIAATAARMRDDLATLPAGAERGRLSVVNQSRIERLEQVAASVEPLRDAWGQLAVGALPAVRLSRLLQDHETLTLAATQAAAGTDYTGALDSIGAAAETLAPAETLRGQLAARGTDVSALGESLVRAREYDTTLAELYGILARNGGALDGQAQAAQVRVDDAQAALPLDASDLVASMADLATGDVTSAIIAIDESRGALAESTAVLGLDTPQP